MRRRLEANDRRDQQQQEEQPKRVSRLIQQDDAQDHRACRADAYPDAVGGADRQGAGGDRQEQHAQRDPGQGQHRWPELGKAVGVFQADRPACFDESCDDEKNPRHDHTLL